MKEILTGIASVLIVIGSIIGAFVGVSLLAYGLGRLVAKIKFFDVMFDYADSLEYILAGLLAMLIILLAITVIFGITMVSMGVYESLMK